VISIKKAAADIDRWEELIKAMAGAFEELVRAAGQYAVEVEPGAAGLFRKHLEVLIVQMSGARNSHDWKEAGASFRGELRDYRDQSCAQLDLLRGEIKAAAEAMLLVADSVAVAGADHTQVIQSTLTELKGLATRETMEEIKAGVLVAAGTIAEAIVMMRRSHQLAVAQMRDEIRLLHKQVDVERRAVYLDRATGVWNRQKIDSHISALVDQDQAFCVLLVFIGNLKRLDQRYSQDVIGATLKAFLQRFGAAMGDSVIIGRWSEEHFAAILDADLQTALGMSREASNRLSGTYTVQDNGLSQAVGLQVVAGVVDREPQASGFSLQDKLLKMAQALAGG
jgi:GGDEF domain-containing protein